MVAWLSGALSAITKLVRFMPSKRIAFKITFSRFFFEPMKTESVFTLERFKYSDKSTIGEITLDGERICYSLELSCRKGDEGGRMAIPSGKYPILMTHSPKFGRKMPLIVVPGRSGIRFHPANDPSELDGCVAPGLKYDEDKIWDSRKAFDLLMLEICGRIDKSKLYIAVIGGRRNEDQPDNV